jgi:hypothetical protein
MGTEYPCLTLLDMARIPEEALGRFLAELPALIATTRFSATLLSDDAGNLLMTDAEFLESIKDARWVDDDLNTYHFRIVAVGDGEKPDEVLYELSGTLKGGDA